jgi:UDP-glucose 4-epimerase
MFYERKCQDDLSDIFTIHRIDIVYHFAAYAAEGLSPFIRKFNYENNLKATANIVNFCITYSVQRLVFTSTLAVYGHGNFDIFDEIQVPKPIDPYGVAKYGCEMDIQIAGEQHGLDWCIIRPHNVYGIKQNIWDKYRNVLGIWMYQYLNSEPFSIFGDGLQTRAFSYVDDSLLPLYKAGIVEKASKEIINLGGIEESSIINAARTLKEVIGDDRIEIKHFEARHEVMHSIPTWKKSVDILGFEHKTGLKEGLTEMWHWAKTQEMRERFIWSQYEIDKDIYSYWK